MIKKIVPRSYEDLKDTAINYNVDIKVIRKTIARHDDFPYVMGGTNGRAFLFNWFDVDEWLATNTWYRGERAPAQRADRRPITPETHEPGGLKAPPPTTDPDARPEPTQGIANLRRALNERDNKSTIQTELLKLELDKKRGLLVEREEVVNLLSMKMARLAKQLEIMPNLIGKKLGLTDETIKMMRDHVDEARRAMVRDDMGYFSKMDEFPVSVEGGG